MPFYEYRCTECGVEFEMMLRFSESDRRPACPKCQSSQTQKKLSAVASFGTATSSGSSGSSGASCGPSRGGFS
jgi:putative FmdB family regulatory protein